MIRGGGDVRLPRILFEGGEAIYPDGLTEGNVLAMIFEAQRMSNEEIRNTFGAAVGQAFFDRGYGRDQLPPQSTTPEGQRVRVEHALSHGLVRDPYGRPLG